MSTQGRVVCLGEALVDLVCEEPIASLGEAQRFTPRVGGSLANIAVVAARFGAEAQLLGGTGDDDWGRWLRSRIAAEGVDVSRLLLAQEVVTSLAFVAVSEAGEPVFDFYGGEERPAAQAGADLEPALAGPPGVLVLGSDTLLSEAEREVSLRAADLAGERGWTVLCDPNLRPSRWPSEHAMRDAADALARRAQVLKCNAREALALAGGADLKAAAGGLLALGPTAAVVTRGVDGALLATADGLLEVPGREASTIVDATGAGDCVSGVLAAALAAGAQTAQLGPVLAVAMDAAASVIGRWGALDGLPDAAFARGRLAAALPPG